MNIYALRAVSLATCLNYFNELPIDKLLQLTKSELTKLIGNINLECTESDVSRITSLWMEHNGVNIISIVTMYAFKILINNEELIVSLIERYYWL